jgi:hypothetical protein
LVATGAVARPGAVVRQIAGEDAAVGGERKVLRLGSAGILAGAGLGGEEDWDARGFVVEADCEADDEGEEANRYDADDDPDPGPEPKEFAIESWPNRDVSCGGSDGDFFVKGLE